LDVEKKNIWIIMRESTILIKTSRCSERFKYVTQWIFQKVLHLNIQYEMLHENASQFFICNPNNNNYFSIHDSDVLFEHTIKKQNISTGIWNQLPTILIGTNCENSNSSIPFDVLSSIFYLITRYEEYLPFPPDHHNRFPATSSVLFQENLLHRPIADEWIEEIRKELLKIGIESQYSPYQFLPTYDIDITWKYLNKPYYKTLGKLFLQLISGKNKSFDEGIRTLKGLQKDPFDSFKEIEDWHKKYDLKAIFFCLVADKESPYDKNIHPLQKDMRKLLNHFATHTTLGIHPSYQSNLSSTLILKEKKTLEQLTNQTINYSRQHYIKLRFPETYQNLLKAQIFEDYSMGYSTHLGFRAGTSRPFNWFDLSNNCETLLNVTPFCFMDTTAHFEQKFNAETSFNLLKEVSKKIKATSGLLVTIFHNFSLGSDTQWKGWKEQYAAFLKDEFMNN
jgi:hypothetical protein